jgi:hypothetical protein
MHQLQQSLALQRTMMLLCASSPVTARTVSANLSVIVMMRVFSATNLRTHQHTAQSAESKCKHYRK